MYIFITNIIKRTCTSLSVYFYVERKTLKCIHLRVLIIIIIIRQRRYHLGEIIISPPVNWRIYGTINILKQCEKANVRGVPARIPSERSVKFRAYQHNSLEVGKDRQ